MLGRHLIGALLYFFKRRQAPEGATLIKDVLDEQECKTLETLLRDLLKNGAALPGKTYSPVTHPNFVKRNQSRETLQFGAYVDKTACRTRASRRCLLRYCEWPVD